MNDATSDAAALRVIADDLMEARRYVRTRPDHARAVTALSIPDIRMTTAIPPRTRYRLWANLEDGLGVLPSDPRVLEGHLCAAARLLQSIARRLEREGDACDR